MSDTRTTAQDTIVCGLRDRVVVARRATHGWTAHERLDGKRPPCLAIDGSRPARIYCGSADRGLWVSDDAGERWRACEAGIAESRITAVTVAEHVPCALDAS